MRRWQRRHRSHNSSPVTTPNMNRICWRFFSLFKWKTIARLFLPHVVAGTLSSIWIYSKFSLKFVEFDFFPSSFESIAQRLLCMPFARSSSIYFFTIFFLKDYLPFSSCLIWPPINNINDTRFRWTQLHGFCWSFQFDRFYCFDFHYPIQSTLFISSLSLSPFPLQEPLMCLVH